MKAWKGIAGFLPHLLACFGIMLMTFFCITTVNSAMGFLSSEFSQQFEFIYGAVTLLTVLAAFSQKKARFWAVFAGLCAAALVAMVIVSRIRQSRDLLMTNEFNLCAMVSGIASLIFAVVLICAQRRAAADAWKAGQSAETE